MNNALPLHNTSALADSCCRRYDVMGSWGEIMGRQIWLLAVALLVAATAPARAWDSAKFEWLTDIVHPTHSYMTEFAIAELRATFPELYQYRSALIDGANQELHELPVEGTLYGVDLDARRQAHRGTNAGSDDMQGWWRDAEAAYAAGDIERAYFFTGIVLHMIQDMGVPAHANSVYHQGTITEFDNFEAMALQKWDPDFKRVDRSDPGYDDPWRYYGFSQQWAAADAPGYDDPDSFSKTWLTADDEEEQLVRDRQARTAAVTLWALRAAAEAFAAL